jgi:hypothetical protein
MKELNAMTEKELLKEKDSFLTQAMNGKHITNNPRYQAILTELFIRC